jgi:benzoate transport
MTSVQKDAAQAGVNVQTLLNEHPFSGFQWVIFALCFLIVLLDGFDTAAIGYIAPSLIGEWGVSKPALAPVLSAALFGLAAGAIFSGPLADRLGRKTVLVGSVAVFAVACLGSGFSPDIWTLAVLRFVTGLGLGAAMPNAVTLMSEYCPDARRATLTNAMFCGFPLGAAFGGFLAAWMIPHFGWRSVLILGGAAPLLLLVALVVLLPESVRHMVANHYPAERIRKVLARIAGDAVQGVQRFVMTESKPEAQASSGMGVVLSREYRVGSVMLWIAYFMGLVIFYALMNWMPVLFKEAGLAYGPLQCQPHHRHRLCADGGLDLVDWPDGRPPGLAGGGRLPGRHHHEHGAVVHAGAGRGLLSDARPCHGRGLDAGHRALRRHRGLLPGGRTVGTPHGLQRDLRRGGHSRPDRHGGPGHQTVQQPRAAGRWRQARHTHSLNHSNAPETQENQR